MTYALFKHAHSGGNFAVDADRVSLIEERDEQTTLIHVDDWEEPLEVKEPFMHVKREIEQLRTKK